MVGLEGKPEGTSDSSRGKVFVFLGKIQGSHPCQHFKKARNITFHAVSIHQAGAIREQNTRAYCKVSHLLFIWVQSQFHFEGSHMQLEVMNVLLNYIHLCKFPFPTELYCGNIVTLTNGISFAMWLNPFSPTLLAVISVTMSLATRGIDRVDMWGDGERCVLSAASHTLWNVPDDEHNTGYTDGGWQKGSFLELLFLRISSNSPQPLGSCCTLSKASFWNHFNFLSALLGGPFRYSYCTTCFCVKRLHLVSLATSLSPAIYIHSCINK